MESLAHRIRKFKETGFRNHEIASELGCSEGYVSEVLSGKKGTTPYVDPVAEAEGATLLALEKTKKALREQYKGEAVKETKIHAEVAKLNAQTRSYLMDARMATDPEEKMSSAEVEKLTEKYLREAGDEIAKEAERHANQ